LPSKGTISSNNTNSEVIL